MEPQDIGGWGLKVKVKFGHLVKIGPVLELKIGESRLRGGPVLAVKLRWG